MEPIAFYGESLSEYTAKQIIDYIITEKLQPGDQLPNEIELGNALGVGRSTVREAAKILISRNIIRIERGRGTFVSQNPGVSDDPLGFQFVQNKSQLLLELLQLRAIIEPSLAELAAQNATAEEINRLQLFEGKLEKAYDKKLDHSEFDVSFHTEVAKCSHNSVVDLIFPLLIKTVPMAVQYTHYALVTETIDDHVAIIKAISDRDGRTARNTMEEHIRRNIRFVRKGALNAAPVKPAAKE